MKALLDSSGLRITDAKADNNLLVAAYARHLEQVPKSEHAPPAATRSVTVGTLATKYILAVKETARKNTVKIRQKYLLSFCDFGFQKRPAETITKTDIEDWLSSNKGWGPGSRRMAIQSVRAMFCWGAGVPNEKRLAADLDQPLLECNPIPKIKAGKPGKRIVYLTEKQEEELLTGTKQVLRTAVKVMIRTGLRPGEFAAITISNCVDEGDAIIVTLKPEQTKTRRGRVIKVKDETVLEMFRRGIERWPKGPIFRTAGGSPHDDKHLRRRFNAARKRAEARGVRFDEGTSIYACRHTFAKRCLNGTFGSKVSLVLLAQFMGNSVEVCKENYLNWSDEAITHEWDAIA